MALVKKFDFIDRQTNVPVVDITAITGSDIFNTGDNEFLDVPLSLKELEASLKDKAMDLSDLDAIAALINGTQSAVGSGIGAVVGAAMGTAKLVGNIAGAICDGVNSLPNMALSAISNAVSGVVGAIGSAVGSVVRTARDALSPMINAAAFAANEVENYISGLFPAGVSSATIRGMSSRCRNRLASVGMGSNFGSLCGSGGACGSGTMANLINSLTGNKFGAVVSGVNNAITGIVALSTVAYDNKLCGAFGTLIGNSKTPLSSAHIARAAAGTLNFVAPAGNIKAVADISKSVQGMNVTSIIPGVVGKLLTSIPKTAERSVRSTATSGFAGLELLYDGWNKSDEDDSLYAFNEMSVKAKGTMDLYKADSIGSCSRNLDSFSNDSKYSELAYSLGSAKGNTSSNFDFAFA